MLNVRNDYYDAFDSIITKDSLNDSRNYSTPVKAKGNGESGSTSTSSSSHTRTRRSIWSKILEHKKAAKEPPTMVTNGANLGQLVGPVSTPEVHIKVLKISDATENAKEIQILIRTFREIWKTIRQRAKDIEALKGMMDGTIPLQK